MKNLNFTELRKNLSIDSVGEIMFSNFLPESTRQNIRKSILSKTAEDRELRALVEKTFDLTQEDYSSGIGGCPEYEHLEYDKMEEGYTTTLVIDLVNFTARSLHSKDDVEKLKELTDLKKKFINSCVVAIGMFNGHIHDITGDGIMAFFNKGEKHEQINNALLSAIIMIYGVKEILNSRLKQEDPNHRDIQVRVGVDTGAVLWTKMGSIRHLESCEVKAVGFSVDSAAKLSSGNSWELKIGENIYDQGKEAFKDLADKRYEDYKRTIDGNTIIYKRFYFDWEKYIKLYDNDMDAVVKSYLPILGFEEVAEQQIAATIDSIGKLEKPSNREIIFG